MQVNDHDSHNKLPSHHESAHKQGVAQLSEFHAWKVIKTYQRKFVKDLRKELSQDISNTSVEHISSLEDYAKDVIKEITRIDSINALPLRKLLTDLFTRSKEYDSSRSLALKKMTKEAHKEALSKATADLSKIKAKEEEITNRLQSHEEKWQSIHDRKKIIEKELDNLEKQRMEVCFAIEQAHEVLKEIQAEVSKVHGEISSLKSITIISNEAAKELEEMRRLVEARKSVIIDYRFDS